MLEFVGLFIFALTAAGLLLYIWTLRKIERDNILLQSKIAEVEQVYDEMQERVDGIRKYRHDLQKHIRIVEQFLKEGNQFRSYDEYRELQGYIRKMQEDISSSQGVPYCDHDILNAIIQIKAEECRQKDVPFDPRISVNAINLDGIDAYHLTGILMNLLDNALEAETQNETAKERGIILTIKKEEEKIFIEVGNDVPESFVPEFKTRKHDKEHHGFGLDIARDYCSRYGGELEIDHDDAGNYLAIRTSLRPKTSDT